MTRPPESVSAAVLSPFERGSEIIFGILMAISVTAAAEITAGGEADVRELIAAKGHAVDNARAVISRLDEAFAAGALVRTPSLDQFLADLQQALEQDEGMKLGGKSAEAARFITRAIDRELDNA